MAGFKVFRFALARQEGQAQAPWEIVSSDLEDDLNQRPDEKENRECTDSNDVDAEDSNDADVGSSKRSSPEPDDQEQVKYVVQVDCMLIN